MAQQTIVVAVVASLGGANDAATLFTVKRVNGVACVATVVATTITTTQYYYYYYHYYYS